MGEQEDLLSKLASKAKRKLNRQLETSDNGSMCGSYEFIQCNLKEEEQKLEKKVLHLLRTCPDCVDPIGKLIDYTIYDNLSEERKQAYILKLSSSYARICERVML